MIQFSWNLPVPRSSVRCFSSRNLHCFVPHMYILHVRKKTMPVTQGVDTTFMCQIYILYVYTEHYCTIHICALCIGAHKPDKYRCICCIRDGLSFYAEIQIIFEFATTYFVKFNFKALESIKKIAIATFLWLFCTNIVELFPYKSHMHGYIKVYKILFNARCTIYKFQINDVWIDLHR